MALNITDYLAVLISASSGNNPKVIEDFLVTEKLPSLVLRTSFITVRQLLS